MKFAEWTGRLVLLCCLLYGAVVIRQPVPERFPVFSWSLFSKVPPAERVDYSVRFTEIDGAPVDPPTYFPQLKTVFRAAGTPGAYALMKQFGSDIDLGRPRAANSRKLFEAAYLKDVSTARYEVVRRRYDAKDRIRCEQKGSEGSDCFLEETVVGEFELGR